MMKQLLRYLPSFLQPNGIIGLLLQKIFRLLCARHGGILIEFAFSVPVFLALIYYLHDLPLMDRWYKQTKFCAHQIAQELQTVSQQRANKKITLNDLRYAKAGACLSLYPGKSMFITSSGRSKFGRIPIYWIHCIRGNSNGTANILWSRYIHGIDNGTSPSKLDIVGNNDSVGGDTVWGDTRQLVDTSSQVNVVPSKIYPGLTIESGQIKMIVECAQYVRSSGNNFTDGGSVNSVPRRTLFSFLLTSPKVRCWDNDPKHPEMYFNSVVVFTPAAGLFDEQPPV